jgi:hypothetical protein
MPVISRRGSWLGVSVRGVTGALRNAGLAPGGRAPISLMPESFYPYLGTPSK